MPRKKSRRLKLTELEKKEKLVEELGVYLEKNHQLPPLATRLYALLMLCPRKGHSFDEIVELSQASKSSVSTNIKLLLNNGSVEYFTKPGERKRYFRLSKDYLKIRMERYREQLEEELKFFKKIDDFNIEYNQVKYQKHKDFGKIYKEYLENQYQNLESTIIKMNQLDR